MWVTRSWNPQPFARGPSASGVSSREHLDSSAWVPFVSSTLGSWVWGSRCLKCTAPHFPSLCPTLLPTPRQCHLEKTSLSCFWNRGLLSGTWTSPAELAWDFAKVPSEGTCLVSNPACTP